MIGLFQTREEFLSEFQENMWRMLEQKAPSGRQRGTGNGGAISSTVACCLFPSSFKNQAKLSTIESNFPLAKPKFSLRNNLKLVDS